MPVWLQVLVGIFLLLGGLFPEDCKEAWNGAGRRTGLAWQLAAQGAGAGNSFAYQYDANGLLTNVTAGGGSHAFTYGDNLLLQSRANAFRTQTVGSRDSRGRILGVSTTVGGTTPLAETQTWRPDTRLAGYGAVRAGAPVGSETRAYAYDTRGRLLTEPYVTVSGSNASAYQFDGNSESGPGVRTLAYVNATTSYALDSQNGFLRAVQETSKPGDGRRLERDGELDLRRGGQRAHPRGGHGHANAAVGQLRAAGRRAAAGRLE